MDKYLNDIKDFFEDFYNMENGMMYIIIIASGLFVFLLAIVIICLVVNSKKTKSRKTNLLTLIKLTNYSKEQCIFYISPDKTVRPNEYVLIAQNEVGVVAEVKHITQKEIKKICGGIPTQILKVIDRATFESIISGEKVQVPKETYMVIKLRRLSKQGKQYYLTMNKNIKKYDPVLVNKDDAGEVDEIFNLSKEETLQLCGEMPAIILKTMTKDEYNRYSYLNERSGVN